jgi:hypothetical protein
MGVPLSCGLARVPSWCHEVALRQKDVAMRMEIDWLACCRLEARIRSDRWSGSRPTGDELSAQWNCSLGCARAVTSAQFPLSLALCIHARK